MHAIESKIFLDKESPLSRTKLKSKSLEVDSYSDLDIYILNCGKGLASISSSIDKSRLSLSLIDVKYLDFITNNDQSKSAYIEMLIENYIIRVQTIYDRALIFTNKVLDLGISNESIGHTLLVANDHVKKFGLDVKLKAISKACREYRSIRNTVIHHDRYTEEELDQLTLIINADHISQQVGKDPFIDLDELSSLTQDYLDTKQGELGIYLDQIEQKLYNFYDTILPVYDYQKDKIRVKS